MILEAVMLMVIPEKQPAFEATFRQASALIAGADGYISHELQRCIEVPNKYLLLVRWKDLDAHRVGFRQSEAYQEWRTLLHHFYEPFPTVEHFENVNLTTK